MAAASGGFLPRKAVPFSGSTPGVVLAAVGIVITIASDSESATSLIPAFIGAVFVGLGLLARAKPDLNHHVMHAAAALALLGVLGSLGSAIGRGSEGWALIAQLATIEGLRDLTLTTNGYLLAAQAESLAEAGLDRITVSLDSHDEEVFRRMSGRKFGPGRVLEGIDAAAKAGLRPIKINCVVQRGVNDDGIVALARRFRGTGHIVRFIEFMDVGTLNGWDLSQVVSAREIVERIDAELPLEPVDPHYPGEVARRLR